MVQDKQKTASIIASTLSTSCNMCAHLYAGPPSKANLLTIEGPISSYSAFVWQ